MTKINFNSESEVEGVFLIRASSRDVFFNRKRKLEILTGFSDGMFDSFEEDEEGCVWKVITTATFDNIDELKSAIKKVEKFNWLFLNDSELLIDGEYLLSDGKWSEC